MLSAVTIAGRNSAARSRGRRLVAMAVDADLDQLVAHEAQLAQQLGRAEVVGPDFDWHLDPRRPEIRVVVAPKPG